MKSKIKFVDSKSEVPIVKFTLCDGTEGFAIIDSGSEISTADSEFVLKHKKAFSKIDTNQHFLNIVGMQSDASHRVIKASIDLIFNNNKKDIRQVTDAVVMSLSHITSSIIAQYDQDTPISFVLGSDFLIQNKAKIDFPNKIITLDNDILG